jgi:putative Mg2+ transporter-C (MgtC) family protein
MDREYFEILEHLMIALAAGGLIGFERSFHGRPAGFRTHTLVCTASSALMLITVYQGHWYPAAFSGTVNLEPTPIAQGIMTGIGFLGAGVIFKEGLTVRGLTTAASIWITAAIGILAGIGFYFPLVVTTVLTLGTLSVFRWIEAKVPAESYAHLQVAFPREGAMVEDDLRRFMTDHGFSVAHLSYACTAQSRSFEYTMIIRTRDPKAAQRLAVALSQMTEVQHFHMAPAGD